LKRKNGRKAKDPNKPTKRVARKREKHHRKGGQWKITTRTQQKEMGKATVQGGKKATRSGTSRYRPLESHHGETTGKSTKVTKIKILEKNKEVKYRGGKNWSECQSRYCLQNPAEGRLSLHLNRQLGPTIEEVWPLSLVVNQTLRRGRWVCLQESPFTGVGFGGRKGRLERLRARTNIILNREKGWLEKELG